MTTIFKVCGQGEWTAAEPAGRYGGSADDARDGFIHFSTAAQLSETLGKHFAGRGDLVLIAVEAEALGDALKWEPSRGGDLFPHLYGPLDRSATLWVMPLVLGADGRHVIPQEARA
jgi:uncharacterized protein (DUF952 family)